MIRIDLSNDEARELARILGGELATLKARLKLFHQTTGPTRPYANDPESAVLGEQRATKLTAMLVKLTGQPPWVPTDEHVLTGRGRTASAKYNAMPDCRDQGRRMANAQLLARLNANV